MILRPKEAAEFLSISRTTLWKLVGKGYVKQVQIGERAVGFWLSDLEKFAGAECTREPTVRLVGRPLSRK